MYVVLKVCIIYFVGDWSNGMIGVSKTFRGVFGGAGFSLPLGEPRNTCRILRQVVRGTEMRTREKCVQL